MSFPPSPDGNEVQALWISWVFSWEAEHSGVVFYELQIEF